jgi:hypothetical protein
VVSRLNFYHASVYNDSFRKRVVVVTGSSRDVYRRVFIKDYNLVPFRRFPKSTIYVNIISRSMTVNNNRG